MLQTTPVQSWSGNIKKELKKKKKNRTCRKDVTLLVNLKYPFQI